MKRHKLSTLMDLYRKRKEKEQRPIHKAPDTPRNTLGDLGAWMEETERHRRHKAQPPGTVRAQVA